MGKAGRGWPAARRTPPAWSRRSSRERAKTDGPARMEKTMSVRRLSAGVAVAIVVAAAMTLSAAASSVPEAAKSGDHEALRALLKQGADVNAAVGDGMTALHWAAARGDAAMTQMLIVAGANLQAATRFGGYAPIHVAAERGHAAVVQA